MVACENSMSVCDMGLIHDLGGASALKSGCDGVPSIGGVIYKIDRIAC